jgi:hypothetical protein
MEQSAEYRESFYRFNKPALREAAQAVIDRWFTPKWNYTHDATGELIGAVREALRESNLVCLSNTHQQLGAELGETEPDEYELIGCINGTHAGRWLLWAENAAAVWPDNTAVYVRRIKR